MTDQPSDSSCDHDGDFHVLPTNDLIEHEIDQDCWCNPTPQLILGAGEDRWIFSHHSLDGRELLERGLEIPKEQTS